MSDRKPTHRLTMRHKDGGFSHQIGAVWTHERGDGMSLVLNAGVAINWRDCSDYDFRIWPAGPRSQEEKEEYVTFKPDKDDDEIPF